MHSGLTRESVLAGIIAERPAQFEQTIKEIETVRPENKKMDGTIKLLKEENEKLKTTISGQDIKADKPIS